MPARILVADDYTDAREMLVELLGGLGYEVDSAENGAEAVAHALAFRPDVVLMDIAMPELDGREATQRIKADPRTRDARVIAFTGNALRGDDAKDVCPGCDLLLIKPVHPEQVVQTIERALEAEADPAGGGVRA